MRYTGMMAALAVGTGLVAGGAFAQGSYPAKPVKIVVPFAAGGSPDTWTRLLVKVMEPRMGQPLLVENRTGGNSTIGMAYAAKAAPDGYTITYSTNSGTSTARALFKSLPYDPINDFAGIIIAQESYFALVVNKSEHGVTLAQLLDKVRKSPDKFTVGTASTTMEMLDKLMENAAKVQLTFARYATPANQVADLLGGRTQMIIHTLNAAKIMHDSGQGYAVAVSSPERLSAMPDTPTIAETLPGVTLGPWTGYFAPAKTPRPIVNFLYTRFAEAVKTPAAQTYGLNSGRVLTMPPEEVDAFVKKDEPRWMALAKAAGIEPE